MDLGISGKKSLVNGGSAGLGKGSARVITIVADHASDVGREKILSICPDPDILVGTCSPAPFSPDFRKVTVAQWEEHLAGHAELSGRGALSYDHA